MKNSFGILTVALLSACSNMNTKEASLKYPATKKTDTVDDYFGTKISDPYRWLEDDNSKETAEWVKEENKVTSDYLSKIPFREQLKQRLTQIWNFEKISTPGKKGKYYFFS